MKVEVEIGTIEVDALPEGVTVEALRTTIAESLAMRFAVEHSSRSAAHPRAEPVYRGEGQASAFGAEIAGKVYGELNR